jgi:hypothetical protein
MANHGARAHSIYGASSAYRWFACPGSVRELAKTPPRPQSPEAAEGTLAHEILEHELRVLASDNDGAAVAEYKAFLEAQELLAPLPDDMLESVRVCVDHVYAILVAHPDAQIFLETPFELPSFIAPGQCFGTCDILIYVPSLKRLYVIDYKHGKHRVNVVENKQLQYYGVGGLYAHPEWEVEEVVLTIVQPRVSHGETVSEWTTNPIDLTLFLAEIDEAIIRTQAPDAPLVPDREQQCFFCDALPTCPAAESKALAMMSAGVTVIDPESLPAPHEVDVVRLAAIIALRPFAKAWFDQCYEYAVDLAINQNVQFPGFKVVEAQGKRKYDGDPAAIADAIGLATGLELDEVFPRKLLGITDMEDKIKRAYKAGKEGRAAQNAAAKDANDFFAQFTIKQSSGSRSLVPLTDGRKAVGAPDHYKGVVIPVVEIDSNSK